MFTFEPYSPSNDKRSCVVRTMTKLCGKEYTLVKEELGLLASELGFGSYNEPSVFEKYMEQHEILKFREYMCEKVGELELEKGTYCVFCTNRNGFFHLFPVVDNVIFDRRNDSLDLYVISVYKTI